MITQRFPDDGFSRYRCGDYTAIGRESERIATAKCAVAKCCVRDAFFQCETSTYAAIPFGALVRANDNREMPALQWAHIAEGDAGLAIFNDAKHGFSNDGSTVRMSLDSIELRS